jgi:hypothetical protein
MQIGCCGRGVSIRPAGLEPADWLFGVAIPSGLAPPLDPQSSTPGWTRTSDPGIRNLRRDDFAVPEETTKSTFSLCASTTSEGTSDSASTFSFTAQRVEKGADLRNPQIEIGLRKSIRPDLIRGRGSPPDGLPLPERESPQERNLMPPIPRRFSEPDRAHRFLLRRTAHEPGKSLSWHRQNVVCVDH